LVSLKNRPAFNSPTRDHPVQRSFPGTTWKVDGLSNMDKRIFKLKPAAAPWDSNWDRAPNHGEVVVRALSPADARIVASEAELDFLETDTRPGDGVSTRFASAFRDDKLYTVIEMEDSSFSQCGPRAVLSGEINASLKSESTNEGRKNTRDHAGGSHNRT